MTNNPNTKIGGQKIKEYKRGITKICFKYSS